MCSSVFVFCLLFRVPRFRAFLRSAFASAQRPPAPTPLYVCFLSFAVTPFVCTINEAAHVVPCCCCVGGVGGGIVLLFIHLCTPTRRKTASNEKEKKKTNTTRDDWAHKDCVVWMRKRRRREERERGGQNWLGWGGSLRARPLQQHHQRCRQARYRPAPRGQSPPQTPAPVHRCRPTQSRRQQQAPRRQAQPLLARARQQGS